MDREYVVSSRSKIGYYFLALLCIGIGITLIIAGMHGKQQVVVYLFGLFFALGSVPILLNMNRKKVVISHNLIMRTDAFSTKEMQIADIKGYRIVTNKSSKSIVFESNNGTPKLTITNATELTDKDELLNWVAGNFTDLDAADMEHEREELLGNTSLGATTEEREASLKNAKNLAIVFSVAACLIAFMTIFYDEKVWAVLDIMIPFTGMAIMFGSKGLIKFTGNKKRSVYPTIEIGMIIPGMVCFFKAISKGEIYDATNLWGPALLLTAVIAAGIYFTGRNKTMQVAGQLIVIVVFSGLFAFGNALHIDKVFDDTQPQIYRVPVVNKWVSHGKSTSYYIKTESWGPKNKPASPSVSSGFYDNTNVGDTITIYLKKGALNIPWYQVGR